ncbi:MAG: glutamine synthetase III [Bacteroidales bacterium]|nr:glutamine synthetase III [Bacteroidales bacterium]
MSSFRQRALDEFATHKAERFYVDERPVSEYFAENVFGEDQMKKYLSSQAYQAVTSAIKDGKKIDRTFANEIAAGMKSWAVEKGATHYTHLFHPLTDSTAEKHESFIDLSKSGEVVENFKGSALVQQEPDASSFPSGGMRSTFEARGYTAWDPSSPAFILDQTLCIPTIFVSYTGEALDMKIPLLKSLEAINKSALEVVNLFDENVNRVIVNLGLEQEYFIVDDALFRARPDLQICNRTLIGHTAAKDHQLEDHYFGAIPSRVMAFMKDFETEAYKLGIMLKTRHNEVAPNQFECAPLYCEANLAVDHNQVLMILMKKVAKKHHLKVLFHEKPFMGINGSGKHCNWSMMTDRGENLLSPGTTPGTNLQFLSVFSSVIRAVYEHNYLLMASVASLNNYYRLGGNEAPPAVMSVFVGRTLDNVINSIENMTLTDDVAASERERLDIVKAIPEILQDNTDRNRTSPFAFTGNRFEFRAVGSSVNVASSMFILNCAVAQQLSNFRKRVDKYMSDGIEKEEAVLKVVRELIIESKNIRFEGNGYSKEWHEEAARRGLKGITNVPESFKAYIDKKSMALFEETKVLTMREVAAHYEIKNEIFTKKLQIEARVMGDLIINHIIPTAIKFQNTLIDNAKGIKELFPAEDAERMCEKQLKTIAKISKYIYELREDVHGMIEARKEANIIEDFTEKAAVYSETVLPYMEKIRINADKLEMIVDDELWPLPKYRELLFCR